MGDAATDVAVGECLIVFPEEKRDYYRYLCLLCMASMLLTSEGSWGCDIGYHLCNRGWYTSITRHLNHLGTRSESCLAAGVGEELLRIGLYHLTSAILRITAP